MQPNLQQSRFHHLLPRWVLPLGAWLLLNGSVAPATAASPSCAGGFTVGAEEVTFDGATFNVVRLESPLLILTAYSLGKWEVTGTPSKTSPLTLRNRRVEGARLSICPVDASRCVRTEDQWRAYLNTVGLSLGDNSDVSDVVDSDQDPKVVKVLGWPTRQALFRLAPAEPGRERHAELHLLIAGPGAGAAFVLSGTEAQVEAARRDFVFLLSRMNHRN